MLTPIKYGNAIELGDSEIAIPLSLSHRDFILTSMLNIVENPSMFIADYADYDSDEIQAFLDDMMDKIMTDLIVVPENGLQSYYSIWAEDAIRGVNDAGATPTITLNANSWYGHYWRQSPAVLYDQVHFNIWLPAGDYYIRHYCNTQSVAGKLTIYIWQMFGSGTIFTPLNAVDLYTAGFVNNVIKTGTFTLTEPGEHKIVWSIGSKNASSSGYLHEWYRTVIARQGAL